MGTFCVAAEGNAIWTIEHAHAGIVNSVAFSPDGRSLARWVGMEWQDSGMWRTGNQVRPSPSALAAALSGSRSHRPTDRYWPLAASFLGIRLWNLQRPQEPPREIRTPTIALLFSPDGATLFSGGNDGLIKIWDAVTLDQRCTLKGHNTAVVGLAMTEDGRTLVSCSWDKTVRFWRAASEEDVRAAGQWAD